MTPKRYAMTFSLDRLGKAALRPPPQHGRAHRDVRHDPRLDRVERDPLCGERAGVAQGLGKAAAGLHPPGLEQVAVDDDGRCLPVAVPGRAHGNTSM